MGLFMAHLSPAIFAIVMAVALLAGFVKGAVGFGLPMIMMGGLATFVAPQQALAALIMPAFLINFIQAFRQGWRPALASTIEYRRFVIAVVVFIAISANFVNVIPEPVFLLILGIPISLYAAMQLAGKSVSLKVEHRARVEWTLGIVSGLYGGVSGIWGPPLLVLLLSLGTEKKESVRVQGVVYLLGAAMLIPAHLHSGVLNRDTLPFSLVLVIPALVGQLIGMQVHDRLDQRLFRRLTQVMLVVVGLNLVRDAVATLFF